MLSSLVSNLIQSVCCCVMDINWTGHFYATFKLFEQNMPALFGMWEA